ncbi:GatB/YqeY domain-containing protein [Solitalea lacus]|uniref:GatB/YqeY domain-containing protein n=1 Tax=Solitalea lacus TaxID=2911172 RepID=UPI001EDB8695|nr:GatB/YqeY domain-containing protein [Solitalea lacus]UKJ08860.1 GatB/YqeY domain-containing protein [Solitalea lacus]
MSLLEKIDQDIKKAMLAKEEATLRGLRSIKSALLLAKTEKGAAETLSEDTEIKVLQKQAKQRKESADIYLAQNRPDLAQIEQEELAVIESYLPKQLSEEEVEGIIKQLIAETGASGMKDMGKVMGAATKQLAGQADGKIVSALVKKLLA